MAASPALNVTERTGNTSGGTTSGSEFSMDRCVSQLVPGFLRNDDDGLAGNRRRPPQLRRSRMWVVEKRRILGWRERPPRRTLCPHLASVQSPRLTHFMCVGSPTLAPRPFLLPLIPTAPLFYALSRREEQRLTRSRSGAPAPIPSRLGRPPLTAPIQHPGPTRFVVSLPSSGSSLPLLRSGLVSPRRFVDSESRLLPTLELDTCSQRRHHGPYDFPLRAICEGVLS
jgi:hypothetical protein